MHPVPLPAPTGPTGLTAAEVAERSRAARSTTCPCAAAAPLAEIVRANVFTRFNAIIGVLWLIMLFVAPFQDSLFGFVILANTGIGIVQEWRAKRTLDSPRGDRRGEADRPPGRDRRRGHAPPRSSSAT